MTIQKIYEKYKIMPNLQLHQLRVAAVGKIICDAIPDSTDTNDVITTCLLHDMGNIIKSDLNYFPEFLEPEGLDYWQEVKNEFIAKYGPDEHVATKAIIAEVIDSKIIAKYADELGFSKLQVTEKDDSLARKICAYADMRVGPYGVLSIEDRLADGRKRYEGRKDKAIGSDRFQAQAKALEEIEKQIFEKLAIKPGDITNHRVNELIIGLRGFEMKTSTEKLT